ncbi:hypothetical protein EW146_g2619 [Bondarzewia mesenterica]|uniref:Cytochrome P450 n=1 Tax=Bondarzewia mesenterica TaxID=1095465 RepID=A0A4S4M026_9AGAM|nr:hypothetical protein EW146_g2619 [Bondarzewia mesenterica]
MAQDLSDSTLILIYSPSPSVISVSPLLFRQLQDMILSPIALCALALLLALVYLIHRWRAGASSPLPPGPARLPLIGNLLDWPIQAGWLRFTEWSKIYGDVVHIEIFGVHVVILNSVETAQGLMNQAIYSDRPYLAMAGELMGFSPSIVLSPYNDHWKAMRKLTHQHLNKLACQELQPSQALDTKLLLRLFLETPHEYRSSLRYVLGKNLIENTYGITVESPSNQFVKLSRETHEVIQNAVIPGSFFVDIFPSLKYVPAWLPGAGFKHLARLARGRGARMVDTPFLEVKRSMENGTPNASVVASLLQDTVHDEMGKDEYEFTVKWAAGSLYGAGTESTVSALETFFLMMALNPGVQKKAHEELDRVVGKDRLPAFEDRDSLPYIEAIMKETLRGKLSERDLSVLTRLGIQVSRIGCRKTTCTKVNTWRHDVGTRKQEDSPPAELFFCTGYHLPKGAIVISNIWGMSKDARYYKEPMRFKPERFLKSPGGGEEPELDPAALVFGFGRRACLGVHYSTATLYITMASVLAAFEIRAQDEQGVDVDVQPDFTGGFVRYTFLCWVPVGLTLADSITRLAFFFFCPFFSHPKPFPCRIVPRSKAAVDLVLRTAEQ